MGTAHFYAQINKDRQLTHLWTAMVRYKRGGKVNTVYATITKEGTSVENDEILLLDSLVM